MAIIVHCTNCHAEISSDREVCPHCGKELPDDSYSVLATLADQNAKLREQIAEKEAAAKAENEALQKKLGLEA